MLAYVALPIAEMDSGLYAYKEVALMTSNRNHYLKLITIFILLLGTGITLVAWVAQPVGAANPAGMGSAQAAPADTPVCGLGWHVVSSQNVAGGDHLLNGVAVVS